jgi:hypothetical protein
VFAIVRYNPLRDVGPDVGLIGLCLTDLQERISPGNKPLPAGSGSRVLGLALLRIGEGEDANVVFGVKAKRGERKSAEQADRRFKMRAAVAWVASAITPPPEGLGISLEKAFERAAKAFSLSDETLAASAAVISAALAAATSAAAGTSRVNTPFAYRSASGGHRPPDFVWRNHFRSKPPWVGAGTKC